MAMAIEQSGTAEQLTVPAAARLLGLSRHTVRAWLRDRRLPFYRVGRRVVINRADVEAFLLRHRVEAASESHP
jgi:excisionase family DNA binding protein